MALIPVLWISAVLIAMATSLIGIGANTLQLMRRTYESARMQALVDAAVVETTLDLLGRSQAVAWPGNGMSRRMAVADTSVIVAVQDERGRIDLNHAGEQALASLFQHAGLSERESATAAQDFLVWRTGAPVGATQAGDVVLSSRSSRWLETTDELQRVLKLPVQAFKQIEPVATVYSGRPFVEVDFAPPQVRQALGNLIAADPPLLTPPRSEQAYSSRTGRAYAITVIVGDASATVGREIVLRLTGDPQQPFWILRQRLLPSSTANAPEKLTRKGLNIIPIAAEQPHG